MKFNPRLPFMSRSISRHLHVLELTKTLFNKSSLFVSYNMEKNMLSMITSNKFRSDPPNPTLPSLHIASTQRYLLKTPLGAVTLAPRNVPYANTTSVRPKLSHHLKHHRALRLSPTLTAIPRMLYT
jgi:hypothetical protein